MIKDYKYKFSVIMPIYNVAEYLNEAIDSVIGQTVGFEDNIQLILVNDGSTDKSGEICREYSDKYPGNVVFIDQHNQGVSAARNAGIPVIEGKYVNFFDSDDRWETDAFEKVWDYLERHEDEVDLVCCKELFFEGQTGEPILNNKFKKGDRIIDVTEEPECIHVSIKSSFIKEETARQEQFDTRISIGEDVKYLTQVIIKRGKYGVLQSALYYFRRRKNNTSITQNPKPGRYIETMEHYYEYLFEYSEEEFGRLLPYIQHTVLNGLKYRVLERPKEFLTAEQWSKYTDRVIGLIKKIDDEIIATTSNIKISTRIHLFKLKHGDDAEKEVYIRNNKIYFRDIPLFAVPNNAVTIDEMNISWRKINISGIVKVPMNDNIGIYIKEDGDYRRVETMPDDRSIRKDFKGNDMITAHKFNVVMGKKNADMTFYLGKDDNLIKIIPKN